jgi:coenzyme F420 hydrogenase subunit beta
VLAFISFAGMIKSIKTVADVARWRMCLGCGACVYVCPEKSITLTDFIEEGIRPVIQSDACGSCTACLDVCPGYENDHSEINRRPSIIPELRESCGPVLEIWEGHAADDEIRYAGSSGGLITALALFCLEKEAMHGVLHIGTDPDNPLRNKTRMSRSRQELLSKTGSRYAPASACDRLDLIEGAPAPCVFIGQPSEVTALAKTERIRPELKQNVGLKISFFCAGSPSTEGTVELLKSMRIDPEQVQELRYRGKGWPGHFAVTLEGLAAPVSQMTYKESWSFLQKYRPYSTHLCPDGTGEDADISCGDPWYREVQPGEAGSSLVVVRTERGREIIRKAIDAGYVALERADPQKLVHSQRNLLTKRGAIWGRQLAFRMFRLPTTRLKGFSLFKNWWQLPWNDKLRSTFGTARRIWTRGYSRPLKLKS